jgi:ribose-phosphate pyrophosphokinase
MTPLVFGLPGNEVLARDLCRDLAAQAGTLVVRRFPDGESYVRLATPVADRPVVLAATLDRPDDKLMPLLLAAATARELGAATVGLVAPYLPYLRQDRRFLEGEALSARRFAALLSEALDWVVTVDPHLHRIHDLREIYSIPVRSVTAAPRVAAWIRSQVAAPLLVGPDEESRQWVEPVAAAVGAPFVVLGKRRLGDERVAIELPSIDAHLGRAPVLLDDIVSTGGTLIQATRLLRGHVVGDPCVVAVHGVFAEGADDRLLAAGCRLLVTCNTIPHPSNRIEVHDLLAAAAAEQLRGVPVG